MSTDSPPITESSPGPEPTKSNGQTEGTAVPIDRPSASTIEGCDDSTCTVSQAVRYQHETKGEVTVVLFADFSANEAGQCMVAVLDSEGRTAQIFPLEYVSAWYKRDSDELADVYSFMDPPSDASGGLFLRSPDIEGIFIDGLRPSGTSYFELLDLAEESRRVNPDVDNGLEYTVDWGTIDENGNYTLVVDGVTGVWDGKQYVAR